LDVLVELRARALDAFAKFGKPAVGGLDGLGKRELDVARHAVGTVVKLPADLRGPLGIDVRGLPNDIARVLVVEHAPRLSRRLVSRLAACRLHRSDSAGDGAIRNEPLPCAAGKPARRRAARDGRNDGDFEFVGGLLDLCPAGVARSVGKGIADALAEEADGPASTRAE